MNQPLAERLRPKSLEEYISQSHLIGAKGSLTQSIKHGLIPSIILWGPPGTGKTTLANIIAETSQRPFYTLSAISSGVKDVREVINKAKQSGGLFTTKNPILFIDEIHRIGFLVNHNKILYYKRLKKVGLLLLVLLLKTQVLKSFLPYYRVVKFTF